MSRTNRQEPTSQKGSQNTKIDVVWATFFETNIYIYIYIYRERERERERETLVT
jgi:hypothetical protein